MRAMKPLVLLLLLFATACAGGGAMRANVTRQLGIATRTNIDTYTRRILQRHQYVIQREALETNMYYETQWRPRTPFDDERELGATSAETRILIRARPRSREAETYTASMTFENRLQLQNGEWVTLAATDEFREYAQRISDELVGELARGIRVR